MKWNVPKIWKDETCYIIGGGPSLMTQLAIPPELVESFKRGASKIEVLHPYLQPFKTKHTIGINMAYKFGAEFIDIVFIGDKSFLKEHKVALQECNSLIVSCASGPQTSPNIKFLDRDFKKVSGISTKEYTVAWNHNSGGSAINFAVHAGVKRIILVGFDMVSASPVDHHWHKYYGSKPQRLQNISYKTHLQCFEDIAKDADQLGIEILNANPESAINVFKKVTLKECLN